MLVLHHHLNKQRNQQRSRRSLISTLTLLTFLPTVTLLGGCAVVAPLSVAGAGSAVSDERTLGVQVDDKVILTRIKKEQAESSAPGMWLNVDVSVLEGRVLLVGCLPNHEAVDEAMRISWSIKGVREVINELEVGGITFSQGAQDSFIANQVRARLLVEKNFLSSNYNISVFKGAVYILGIGQSQDEKSRAISIASSVSGVKKVINHVILRSDPRRWNRI